MLWKGLTLLSLTCTMLPALAQQQRGSPFDVSRTQQERQNTRWTLTEWLHIKERMRMMDLWLAMFSKPEKERFSPEILMDWKLRPAGFQEEGFSGEASAGTGIVSERENQRHLRTHVWLSNIISSSTGMRTFNVDLGMEAAGTFDARLLLPVDPVAAGRRSSRLAWAGTLRVLGKNIQDTGLFFRVGQYRFDTPAILHPDAGPVLLRKGLLAGVEGQMYFLKWFGIEGALSSYDWLSRRKTQGEFYGYAAESSLFLELSLLRLSVGQWAEKFQQETAARREGYHAGVRLNF